jgi:serine/threonine protein kinase
MLVPEWFFRRRGKADPLDRAVQLYEASIRSGGPRLAQYWTSPESDKTPSVLAALVKIDLRRRFEAGERPRALEYLRAFPVLAEVDDRVISLVYEEFCLLEEHGERPDSLAFCEDYGPWRDSLRSQLAYHRELSRAIGAETSPVNFPDPGDRFDKYRLTSLLGVGGVARVYLATEEELGDRQVAIKVSASFGQEPSILAKLDHRNIVPILTVAESESGLRGICMPYRPGSTLEELIRRIGRGKPPRSARAISDALRPTDSQAGFPPEEQRVGWEDFPIDRTFPEAVAWIGLALAHALSYLHERGIFHRDIKPANILLAYREGPQLLDFNLAQVPSSPERASAAQKGGTLPYMAPEQLRAFLDSSAWDDVESAADIYSLGLVLRELLTGRPPELPTSQGSLAREIQSLIDRRLAQTESAGQINPEVPPALDSIIGKCLAFRPEDRYATADDLAVDLRQFLDRKPLLFAPNTSKIELGINWAYRNGRSVVSTLLIFAVLASLNWAFPRGKPGEAEFEKAERHLYSGRLGDLERAKKEFEELHKERSDTARSSLGLALTLKKLGDPADMTRTSDLLENALKKEDAERVIRAHLVKDPRSYVLHLNLGIILLEHGQTDLARKSLEQSLEINPKGYAANRVLAKLEDRPGRYEHSLGPLAKAIEVGQRRNDTATIDPLRKAMLRILVELIDRRLEPEEGAPNRAEAASYCRELESRLQCFKEHWCKTATAGEPAGQAYSINLYEGCLCSIKGVLNAEEDDPARFFEEAGRRFEQARRLSTEWNMPADRLLTLQEAKLARRRDGR